MEASQENQIPIETQPLLIPQTDCLIEFGHSIEKGRDNNWYLTRLLQTVEEKGVDNTGYRIYERTGKREPVSETTTNAIVGGGVFTTAATVEVYKRLFTEGKAPKLVVHCGGRPGYLESHAANEPEVSEGSVMQKNFNRRLKDTPRPPQVLINYGKTTIDDIKNGLNTVIENGCQSVTFVGLGMRMPRFEALYEMIMQETDKYAGIKVNLLPAEDVIADVASKRNRTAQFKKIWDEFEQSEGYKRNVENEKAGIQRLKGGTYGQSPWGAGKT